MTIIAFYNIKGGVGKTAGCVNLAYQAAREGNRTLLWDLDPQGSATFYFRHTAKLKGGFKKLLTGEGNLEENLLNTEYENLDLVPADFGNRHLDAWLEDMKQGKKKFRNLLGQLEGQYDYLMVDCPPGIGPLSEAIFSAAGFVVMPAIPTTLSIRTFDMVIRFFEDHQLPIHKIIGYFSMVDIRKNLHNEVLGEYYKHKRFLRNYIPYLSTVEKMGSRLAPVAAFAPSSYAAQCFRELWKELKKKMAD